MSRMRNYRLYKIRTAALSERYCIENYHSKIIAGVQKNEKHYSRGGNSGNACFVSLCSICACILISEVLHVIPYVSRCQNFRTFKNSSLTAHIISNRIVPVFFSRQLLQSLAMTRTIPLPTRAKFLDLC